MTTCRADFAAGVHAPAETLVLHVPTEPEHIARSRRAVHAYLLAHAVPSFVADDVRLVASELITNAIVHGCSLGPVDVEVALQPPREVVLQVSNDGPVARIPPVDRWEPAPPLAMSGRGLGIVRRLCDTVEVRGDDHMATVVCRRRWQSGSEP